MTEKVLNVKQGEIHYWVNSFVEGRTTLVFLPGLTADHRLFAHQIEYFAPLYNVLVWDAPGHNRSRPFELNFSLMDKAAWLHDILMAEGVRKPVLIGQSMGGYLSQCYIEKYPGSASAFVSIDSASLKRKYMTAAEIWLLKHTEIIYRPYPWKALVKSGADGCAVTEYGQKLMCEMMSGYTKNDYCALVCHGYRILANAIEANLPYRIDCPALLICGENDKAGYTKRYNERWSKEESLPLTWIPNAGHNSNTDQPDIVNAAIRQLLTKAGLE